MIKKIKIVDTNGAILIDDTLFSLPIKEESIIKKSIELFGDPEPCIIHRSFALKKLLFEISEHLEYMVNSGFYEISIDALPESISQTLDIGKSHNKQYTIIVK
jgi:hypothetical protein